MEQVLYRKYRSRNLDEVAGQDHITSTLKNALKKGNISHAYLFTGPRGVGKTSVARILAHDINDLEYNLDREHLDIIEIDAASNRKIDQMRDLREKVRLSPTSSKYKVYIIDEVHMLTNEAFNALLKTLEEPPKHVVFILATTEVHKVPDTIISRTQRFTFRPIDPEKMIRHLKNISKAEGLKLENDAAHRIARHSGGSFRDALTILDQLRSETTSISSKHVEDLLGLAPSDLINDIVDAFEANSLIIIREKTENAILLGIAPEILARSLAQAFKERMVETTNGSHVELIEDLLGVENSSDPLIMLEISLAKPLLKDSTSISDSTKANNDEKIIKTANAPVPEKLKSKKDSMSSTEFDWDFALAEIKKQSDPLYALLKIADVDHDPKKQNLVLRFSTKFHAQRASGPNVKTTIRNIFQSNGWATPEIEVIHSEEKSEEESRNTQTDGNLVRAADVLGGKIVEL